MQKLSALPIIALIVCAVSTQSQRITTIQLDGVQYFVSRMNPYSPELNYFLAYQYCRSLGLQLASFETKEKADSITQYLSNAGYNKYDFWTSGNKLGTDMFLWMSTGLPFNATFNYMKKTTDAVDMSQDIPTGSTSPQRTARESDSGASNGCVTLRAPTFEWDTDDCMTIKDFICEQTRCYYYNYGSIPVSSAQGKLTLTTTTYKPPTSPPSYHSGEFPSELRSSTRTPSNEMKIDGDDVKDDSAILPHETMSVESTNGPYDSFHGIEIHREPASFVDQQHDVDYVSTIEPETVTIYERSFKPVI